MLFTILKPYEEAKQLNITWLEVNTNVGSFVLQKGHAPMILAIKENSEIHYELESGLEQTIFIKKGLLKVDRQEIRLITQ